MMNSRNTQYLHFTNYRDLVNWSVQYVEEHDLGFTKKYPMVRIGTFLSKSKDIISVQDNVDYKQVTLKINNGGIIPRNNGLTVKGLAIGTKRQTVIHAGQFIMSKIDARNGAFGIVPKDLDGAIVTNDFPVFNVDTSQIIPQFLVLISATDNFIEFARKCSSGTTNRKRIDVNTFLNQAIPLPEITAQEKILERYEKAIRQANTLEQKASEIINNTEDYLLSELGISTTVNLSKQNTNAHYLRTISYSSLERWDCCNFNDPDYAPTFSGRYPIVEMGTAVNFISRRWNHQQKSFRYIEIGSVDSQKGILSADTIPTHKAPSRATQVVKNGDLIIGTTRPYLKKFAIVTPEFDDCVCSSGFQVISPSKGCNLTFLLEYLKTETAIKQFQMHMTGALYPAITAKKLKKILIPLPPLSIQNTIVEHLCVMREQLQQLPITSSNLRKQAENDIIKILFD